MIDGILGSLYSGAVILAREVIAELSEQGEAESKKLALTDEDCRLRVGCIELYIHLQTKLPVEEDWRRSDQWVVGIVTASMDEIKEAIQGEIEGFDFDEVWAALEDAGAVAVVGGVVTLPRLAGKIATLDDLLKDVDRKRARLQKLEPVEEDLLQDQDELSRRVAGIKRSVERVLGVAESQNAETGAT